MTNNEKALELVQKCLDDWPYAATRVVDIMKRLEQVNALLKEQEAVEPILDSFLHKRCPSCRTLLKGKYCHECGQAVKWE